MLDANEICDIGITGGKRGACVTDCGKDPCAKLHGARLHDAVHHGHEQAGVRARRRVMRNAPP